ncbi:hypothetical protein [Shewanella fidelis]|uniref:Uncharacterized protein n=1 Tax=Shewanella fidelis TaxID=173509 RepID=A0AAW8NKR3_9GAMM|nr:hypothetical protein [Shewanella fidelis]MDR8523853.1 hypothetical protein [Shewanella fidelis]MDW4810401.1 hypothetical protein [Shewanella fidelis]MDW4823712.1 hypothetical protein [Shewanella fidelis]
MTPYALELVDYIEQHNGSGQMLAELYADENFSPDWRTRQQQPKAESVEITISGDDDE